MRIILIMLLLAVAACGTTSETTIQGWHPMIDQPTPPFPYNSKFCT